MIDLLTWLDNSPMIVRNPSDSVYSTFPDPPQWGIFRNWAFGIGNFPNSNVVTDDSCEVLETCLVAYENQYGEQYLTLAQNIASELVNRIVDNLTAFGYGLTLIPQRWIHDSGWQLDTGVGAEYHTRTALITAYAFTRLYEYDTSNYGSQTLADHALDLLDSVRRMQQFSDDRAGDDIPAWMEGSISEWWNEGETNTTPQWAYFPLFNTDIVYKAYTLASATLGDTQNRGDAGTYQLLDVRNNYIAFVERAINEQDGLMSDHDAGYLELPYQRIHATDLNTANGMNIYSPESSTPSADADWTSDTMFWCIEGLLLANNSQATDLYNTLLALAHDSPIRFKDSYQPNGTPTVSPNPADDVTQANALARRSARAGGLSLPATLQYLIDTQIDSANPAPNGAWTWTGDEADFVETIATAVVLAEAIETEGEPESATPTSIRGGRHALESSVAAYVYHGEDPDIARPGTFGAVVWIGSVKPDNMIDGDFWEDITDSGESVEAYMRVDGTTPFTAPVGGVNPTNSSHLVTREYVDSLTTDAEDVFFTSSGLVVVTTDNVQAAIAELDAAHDDISNDVDTVSGSLDSHTSATSVHSATSGATASRIVIRDSNGRASFVQPTANSHAATKVYVDNIVSAVAYETLSSSTSAVVLNIPTNIDGVTIEIAGQDTASSANFSNVGMRFNNDSNSSNYRSIQHERLGSGLEATTFEGAGDLSSLRVGRVGDLAYGTIIITIPRLTGSRKSFVSDAFAFRAGSTGENNVSRLNCGGAWDHSDRITSIRFECLGSESFASGSIFAAYPRRA